MNLSTNLIYIGAAVGTVALIGLYMQHRTPRAVRNNNPLNIRLSDANKWKGELPKGLNVKMDPAFESFYNAVDGYRAAVILLRNYQRKYSLHTLNDIINRFAPTTENDTRSYINAVSDYVGVGANDAINLYDENTMLKVLLAMHKHEAGGIYFGEKLAKAGIQAAA